MTPASPRPHRTGVLVVRLCVALAVLLTACSMPASASRAALTTPPTTIATARAVAQLGTTTTTRTLTLDGLSRSYLVVVPAGRHGRLPLLMVLHGRGVTPAQEELRTGFVPLAQEGKAVLVYPAGYGESWNAVGCCGEAQQFNVDDTAFLAAVVADATSHLPVDPSRVYLAGYSNGARMAFTEVCAHPTLFTAFATFGAVPTQTCQDTSVPVPALISAGAADPELATTSPPRTTTQVIDSTVALWRERDGCTATAESRTIKPAQLTRWSDCRAGTAVESVLYDGVTHYWPSANQVDIPFNITVGPSAAAATLMWSFLSAQH